MEVFSFKFPELIKEAHEDPYLPSSNETDRNVNCRRMNLEFELVDPKEEEEQVSSLSLSYYNQQEGPTTSPTIFADHFGDFWSYQCSRDS